MKKQTLTIVIPVYNEQDYIVACLKSIAEQSEQPDEVIVVDNNCTDHTIALAKQFEFVKIIKAKRQGIVFARNAGFNEAKGDFIGRIDADSLIEKDWVAKTKRIFKANPDVNGITGICYFYDFPFRRTTQQIHQFIYYSIQKTLSGTDILWGSNMAIRKTAWHTIGQYCHQTNLVHEDIDLSLLMHKSEMKIIRSKSLHANVSMRRGNLVNLDIIKYLSPWPKTYYSNSRYLTGLGIHLIYILIISVLVPALFIHSQSVKYLSTAFSEVD